MLMRNARPKAFTLVEILVVLGIIAILIGLLFPALLRVGRAAKKAESMSRMRQINLSQTIFKIGSCDGRFRKFIYGAI